MWQCRWYRKSHGVRIDVIWELHHRYPGRTFPPASHALLWEWGCTGICGPIQLNLYSCQIPTKPVDFGNRLVQQARGFFAGRIYMLYCSVRQFVGCSEVVQGQHFSRSMDTESTEWKHRYWNPTNELWAESNSQVSLGWVRPKLGSRQRECTW
jgi:hypothetical protein